MMLHYFSEAPRDAKAQLVQMGSSLLSTHAGLASNQTANGVLLLAGVAVSFGSVFDAPFIGAIFALKVPGPAGYNN